MANWHIGLIVAAALGAPPALAQTTRTAISCTGDAVQDFKSFNLPAKTVPETRIYVIDTADKSIAMLTQGELVPLCDKAKPACHIEFLNAGIKVDYAADGEAVKAIYNRGANTIGQQTDNAALTTTFEGHCQPADLPTATPAK